MSGEAEGVQAPEFSSHRHRAREVGRGVGQGAKVQFIKGSVISHLPTVPSVEEGVGPGLGRKGMTGRCREGCHVTAKPSPPSRKGTALPDKSWYPSAGGHCA